MTQLWAQRRLRRGAAELAEARRLMGGRGFSSLLYIMPIGEYRCAAQSNLFCRLAEDWNAREVERAPG
jgi:hypothetical protein